MSKHTPGPWRVDGEYLSSRVDVGPANGVSIFEACCSAYIAGSQDEEIANARLIAAAPEMYELIEQVADLQNGRFDGAAYMELAEEMDRVADLARDLLARIKGEVKNEL